ncbi:MAG: EamA family transporter [Fusobacterium sp.]|nr:EamA family transporter [Fusobacterium sp.]
MLDNKSRSLMQIHFAVLLFGLTGVFGKLITLPSTILVLGRLISSSVSIFAYMKLMKKDTKLKSRKHFLSFILLGFLLAVHWTTFYESIKLSTVAIGLLTFSTFPVFVTFIEPYFFKEKLQVSDIVTAVVTFIGIFFVVPEFEFGNDMTIGALLGILSGFTYAFLSVLNRKFTADYSGAMIAFCEQSTAAVFLIPCYFMVQPAVSLSNIFLTILLGTIFTALPHTIFIGGMKYVKTQTAGIITCLEPLYGIILAGILIHEIPDFKVIAGGIIILGTVFYSTLKSKK